MQGTHEFNPSSLMSSIPRGTKILPLKGQLSLPATIRESRALQWGASLPQQRLTAAKKKREGKSPCPTHWTSSLASPRSQTRKATETVRERSLNCSGGMFTKGGIRVGSWDLPNSRKDLGGIYTSKGAQRFKGRRSFCPPGHRSRLTGSHGDKARGRNVGRRGFRDENLAVVGCVSGAWHNWLPFPQTSPHQLGGPHSGAPDPQGPHAGIQSFSELGQQESISHLCCCRWPWTAIEHPFPSWLQVTDTWQDQQPLPRGPQ